jgi:hypothetical protein
VSDKTIKTLLMVGVLAVGAWFAWRYYQNYKAGQTGSGVPQLGTNLNSIAPFLVGGSSGPAVAPAVNTPVNITITESSVSKMPDISRGSNPTGPVFPGTPMMPARDTDNQLETANSAPADTMQEDTAEKVPLIKRGYYGR